MFSRRAIRVSRHLIEVHYYADGTYAWMVCEPDTRKKQSFRKWRRRAYGWCAEIPSWEELHNFLYVRRGDECRTPPPLPIEAMIRMMQYDVHCMAIEDKKRHA